MKSRLRSADAGAIEQRGPDFARYSLEMIGKTADKRFRGRKAAPSSAMSWPSFRSSSLARAESAARSQWDKIPILSHSPDFSAWTGSEFYPTRLFVAHVKNVLPFHGRSTRRRL
jgi:hypothetical protein